MFAEKTVLLPVSADEAFAVATAQKVTVSEQVSRYVLDLAQQIISPQQRAGGSLADAIEVGPDADILSRLVAFTGRPAA